MDALSAKEHVTAWLAAEGGVLASLLLTMQSAAMAPMRRAGILMVVRLGSI